MNFTILTPGDCPVMYDKSDATDSNFGGQRRSLNKSIADAKDYTKRTGQAPSVEENPVDTAIRDIDDMSNLEERKNDFSQQEIRADVQKGNEGLGIQSDPENRPRMDEGTDAVRIPNSDYRKQLKKSNRWQFDKSEHYEGEIS